MSNLLFLFYHFKYLPPGPPATFYVQSRTDIVLLIELKITTSAYLIMTLFRAKILRLHRKLSISTVRDATTTKKFLTYVGMVESENGRMREGE